MERFTVNGTEVEFDPFDLDVMESYMAGLDRVDGERRVKQEGETPTATLRRACNAILDFFDDQLGEGKAEELFGQRVNVKASLRATRSSPPRSTTVSETTPRASTPPRPPLWCPSTGLSAVRRGGEAREPADGPAPRPCGGGRRTLAH